MTHPVRWGILSTANIGRAFIRGVGMSPGSCVQAVASREWTRASEWAKEHGIPRVFGSYDDLIHSGEVDAIYNPLPNSLHAEWTIKALEAGVPVLCEKPFAVNAAEARDIVAVSKRTGVRVAEAFMYRFHPMYDRVLQIMADGMIGDLVTIHSAFAFHLRDRSNIRASAELAGGALMDVGCYCVNLARRLAGCEPIAAHAFERRTTVDDTLVGSLEFPHGVLSGFLCSIEHFGRSYAEIIGTEGMLLLENPWFPGDDEAKIVLRQEDRQEIITTPGANSYHLEVEDFEQALRTHGPLRWSPDDAVANMAVLDALYASAKTGAAVPIETAR